MEIGNNKENLILKTAGKLKVLWGNKFIDLLDNNGNLNIKHQLILKTADDIDDISKDGIYVIGDKIVFRYDDNNIILENNSSSEEESEEESEESDDSKERILSLEEKLETFDLEEMLDRIVYIEEFLTQAYPLISNETNTFGFVNKYNDDYLTNIKVRTNTGDKELKEYVSGDLNKVSSGDDLLGYAGISIYPISDLDEALDES